MPIRLIVGIAIAAIAGACRGMPARDKIDLLVAGGTVINPPSSVRVADIAVNRSKIVAVGTNLRERYDAAQVIDAAGGYVIPGLADMHTHFGTGIRPPEEDDSVPVLARLLYYGVTTILNLGSFQAWPERIDALRTQMERGVLQGPRLLAVGALITVPGSHPTTTIYSKALQDQIAAIVAAAPARGPIDLARETRRATTLVRTAEDMEFVRRQADRLMNEVATAVRTIPAAVSGELVTLVGTQDGQLLAPIVQLINSASTMAERSVWEARRLLQDMDPARDDGTIGRALKAVRDLLDAERKDSVQARIESAIDTLGDRGGQFAKGLQALIDEALNPVVSELRNMTDRTLAQHAAAEVVNRTTEKGLPYELEVLARVQGWARAVGATVDHVGHDNQPGDIVVRFGAKSVVNRELALVIEARDRVDGKGLKRVAEDLETALRQRSADCGLYIGRTQAAFAKEIGEWADGRCTSGPYVACIDGLLESALRYVIALVRLDDFREAHREIDAAAIEPHIAQVRTSMERTRSIKTKLTAVDSATADVRRELDALRAEVVAAVEAAQGILSKAPRNRTS